MPEGPTMDFLGLGMLVGDRPALLEPSSPPALPPLSSLRSFNRELPDLSSDGRHWVGGGESPLYLLLFPNRNSFYFGRMVLCEQDVNEREIRREWVGMGGRTIANFYLSLH